jgi:hypothetical protein
MPGKLLIAAAEAAHGLALAGARPSTSKARSPSTARR